MEFWELPIDKNNMWIVFPYYTYSQVDRDSTDYKLYGKLTGLTWVSSVVQSTAGRQLAFLRDQSLDMVLFHIFINDLSAWGGILGKCA